MNFAQPVLDDVGETNENRKRNAAPAQGVDELFQIDGAIDFFGGMNEQMSIGADGKVAFSPTGDVVHFCGIGGGPAVGWFTDLRGWPAILVDRVLTS